MAWLNLRVVGPAWRAHPHLRHLRLLDHGQRQPQRASAARGLHAFDPAVHIRVRCAEHIRHQRRDKAHVAFGAEIGLALLRCDQPLLRRLDRAEHRGVALAGLVDPDAEVDFGRTRVLVVELDQREQRIGGLLGKVG